MFKKFAEFFGCAFCAVGFIGGILICCLMGDYWPLAIGIGVLGFAAFPRVKAWFIDLRDE